MKRIEFVIRRQTKIAQKLPENLESKILNFQRFANLINLLSNIGNIDETLMNFDMVGNLTVYLKSDKTLLLKTTDHKRNQFIVVLSFMADDTKFKPMIIFKRKTMAKLSFNKYF